MAFGLLKYSLPIDDRSSRAWHFVWDQQFFRFAEAIRGSFAFDFELYRSFDPATRRLFLLLQKIFWRNDQSPTFDVRQLGVNVLGCADSMATKEIKQKLIRAAQVLLNHGIIRLPLGTFDVKGLFIRKSKGVFVVRFERGAYFDQQPQPMTIPETDSPLAEPLQAIGFDVNAIARILRDYKPRLIQEWADITLAAMERKLIKQSPQAYFSHYIREAAEKRTTPPDWWREIQKQEFERQRTTPQPNRSGGEEAAFERYLQEQGREAFERVMQRLFDGLKSAGHDNEDARRNAEYTARVHLRRQFRQDHPEFNGNGPATLANILTKRPQS